MKRFFFHKMDLTSCVLFQFMGHGAPAIAMQGLFYNQPCSYYGAALSREQLGARTTVTFPRPFFPPPRAFMFRLVNHFPLTSHLVSSRLFCQAASLPSSTSKRRGAAEAWGQMGAGHAARIGIRRGQRHRRLRHGPGYPPPLLFF